MEISLITKCLLFCRYEEIQKGEDFKLIVNNATLDDGGDYCLQIGDRPCKANVTVIPCECVCMCVVCLYVIIRCMYDHILSLYYVWYNFENKELEMCECVWVYVCVCVCVKCTWYYWQFFAESFLNCMWDGICLYVYVLENHNNSNVCTFWHIA